MFGVQKNSSYMKEILSNIPCHTFFLIQKKNGLLAPFPVQKQFKTVKVAHFA